MGLRIGVIKISEERCVMCGEPIPEGRMICHRCEDVEPSFDITQIIVSLNKITDIKDFVNLVSKCTDDVTIGSGRFKVNAKSIMVLFSLDLTKTLKVDFYGRIPYDIRDDLKKFIIKG